MPFLQIRAYGADPEAALQLREERRTAAAWRQFEPGNGGR